MAKFTPTIAGEISGSIGAITFSHNRGGAYMRLRSIPVNPNTAAQSFIRTLQADLSNDWVTGLTQAQRDGWNLYDENLPAQFGNRGGIGQYVRSNVPRGYASFPGGDPAYDILPNVADPPTIYDVGAFTPTGIAASVASGLAHSFDNGDEWADEDDAALFLYMSPGQNPSINNYNRRYNLVGITSGVNGTPPTSPTAFTTLPFPITLGLKYFFKVRVSRADGRYSAEQRLETIAVA